MTDAPLISISSNEGRIGRIGWTNARGHGFVKGKVWWSSFWPWAPHVAPLKGADRAEQGEGQP